MRRPVDLVVLSDVHLGTRSCRVADLERYLAGIDPRRLVLNGDIVDLREWGKGYWPASHDRVARRLLDLAERGQVDYVAGNHDALLRLVVDRRVAGMRLVDRLELELDGRRTLLLHGDRVEAGLKTSRWLRRWACRGYHAARFADRIVNQRTVERTGQRRLRLQGMLKRVASGHLDRYDAACAAHAAEAGFDAVVVGHIHRPRIADLAVGARTVRYCNSGDWVDHATALEFHAGAGWRIVDVDGAHADAGAAGHAPGSAGILAG